MDEMSETTVYMNLDAPAEDLPEGGQGDGINAPSSPAPKKPKKTGGKKALIIIAIILGALLLTVGCALLSADLYIDHMLDYISYDPENIEELEWSGVDIDDPSYGIEDDMGIDMSDFVDPEAGTDTDPNYNPETSSPDTSDAFDESENDDETDSNGNSGSGGNSGSSGGSSTTKPRPPEPPFQPDYEIIEGLFDGENISDAYNQDVINVLLIGADTISGKSARSDTMILMSINNIKKRIVFSSFMRDTYVSIPGRKDNRLNAAFAAGGPSLLIKTIKQNFDIDIDYYVMVSISSFEMAVDVIGGLDLTINADNYNYFKTWNGIKGLSEASATDGTHTIHLNGGQALAYARSRNFSNGDFTRTLHQRDLLKQAAARCRNCSLSELHELLKAVLPYVRTNIPKDTLKSMIWHALTYISYDITDARVPCPGSFQYANINGREVLSVNLEANKRYLKAKIYG